MTFPLPDAAPDLTVTAQQGPGVSPREDTGVRIGAQGRAARQAFSRRTKDASTCPPSAMGFGPGLRATVTGPLTSTRRMDAWMPPAHGRGAGHGWHKPVGPGADDINRPRRAEKQGA